MASNLLNLALFALTAKALPQISLPNPLIPSIPGVTEPLSSNAPPLPILQLPTPPLPSEPFAQYVSAIKPKKIGYFWTGAGDNEHADFLATFSLDDDTFGQLIWITDVPTSGNSPHHLGPSLDGSNIWGGGLLSLLKTQDTGFFFDMKDPYRPAFATSNRGILASIADEVRAKKDGGYYITYMGSAVGTSPGRLIETDANYNIIHEWPEDVAGTLNILGEQFSPHGLTINEDTGIAITSDFVVPITVLKPTLGIQHANTLRLWNLKTHTITKTLTIPNGQGIQDVKFIPGNPEGAALACAVGVGEVWIIYPYRIDSDGTPGVVQHFATLPAAAAQSIAIYSDISQNGKFAYFTSTLANQVYGLDISDLSNPKPLKSNTQDIVGPHYIKLAPDQKHLLVTDYFVQGGEISVLNTPADFKAQWIDIGKDGSLHFNRSIDFANHPAFRSRGGAKPHSAVVYDFTDPKNPKYY